MSDIILKAQGLTKVYSTDSVRTEVLKGVDVEVHDGEFVAVVGESGSGKSTLLYLLAGIDKPTDGTVELLGRNLAKTGDEELAAMRRREVSFVYQFDNLVPHLTAYENIVLPLLLDGKKEKEFASSVADICAFLGIDKRLGNLPRQLSGGEQQMLAMGRALMAKPKLLLLDEPSMGLAPILVQEIFSIIQDIKAQGTTVLLVEQNARMALSIADRGYVLETGKVVYAGTGEELAESEEIAKAYLGG